MSVYPSCIKKYFEMYKVDFPTFRDEFVVYAYSSARQCYVTTMKMGFETVQSPVFDGAVLMTVRDERDLPNVIDRFRVKNLLYLNDAKGECIACWRIEEYDIVPILEQIFPSWDMRFRDVHRPVETDSGLKEAKQRQEIKVVVDSIIHGFWTDVLERVRDEFRERLDRNLWEQILSCMRENLRYEVLVAPQALARSRMDSKFGCSRFSGLKSLDRLLTQHLSISY